MKALARAFERRSTEQTFSLRDPALKNLWGGYESNSGANITPENSLRISGWYAGIQIIAGAIASLPLITYQRLPRGKQRAITHPNYRILHDQPNPWMTPTEFFENSQAHVLTRGNGFSLIERNGAGQVMALWPIPPDRVRMQIVGSNIYYYYYPINGGEQQIPMANMLHVRGLARPSDYSIWGYSPVDLAREALGLAKVEEEYRARFFKNDGRPGAIVEYPNHMSDEAYQRFKADWQDTYGSLGNKHKVAFLEQGLKWHDVGFPPQAAEFIEGRKFQLEEIARILRIPLVLLQSTEKATSWGCLPGDTEIFTDQGPIPIENIRPGAMVWSLGEEGMVRAKVTAQQMTGIRKFLTIETVGRIIRPTGNHRMLVRRYNRVGKGNNTKGWETLWLSADQVRVGDYLPIPHGLRGSNGDKALNGQTLTVGMIEFCGLFTGDGNIDGVNRVEIAHENDPDYMEYYLRIIQDEFLTEGKIDKRKTRTRFSSSRARNLLACGFLGDCMTKRVPGWVFGLRRDLQLGYLRGYLDSDGSVQRGRIIYSSANKSLLEDIRHLCIQVGIPVGRVCIGRKAGPCTFRGKTYQAENKYQLSLSSIRFNSRIGSNSPRKAARFIDTQHIRKFRYDDDYDSGVGGSAKRKITHGWSFPDIKLHKVKRIAESQVEIPVYDITVEGTETFVADGVLVHNTGIEQFMLGFVQFTIREWLKRWERRINISLFTPKEQQQYFCEFLVKDLLRADSLTEAQVLQIERRNGVINANQWLDITNRNEIGQQGETYVIESNMQRLDQIGQDIQPPAEAGNLPATNGNGNGVRYTNGGAH